MGRIGMPELLIILAIVIIIAIGYLVVNLLVDLSYAFLDPRIRLG